MGLRRRVWEIVEPASSGDRASLIFDVLILVLIFLNVAAVMLGSVNSIEEAYDAPLRVFEIVCVLVFTLEYLARIWACTADARFKNPVRGRVRFALRPMLLIDLAAVLPFYLPYTGIDLRSLRIFRLLRILRVAKVGRYYTSLKVLKQVLHSKREELVLSSTVLGFLLVASSTILYYCEHDAQPEAFSSIPATMWWSVATLTTVGYGDMYPVTFLGRFSASIIAILGIGMFALPTGILGAGFVETIQKQKESVPICPHCGKRLDRDDVSMKSAQSDNQEVTGQDR